MSEIPVEQLLEVLEHYRPETGRKRYEALVKLDEHFANLWLKYSAGMLARPALSPRERFLIMTGQFTMTNQLGQVAETTRAALRSNVNPEDLKEVILQASVYAGDLQMFEALDTFLGVCDELGVEIPEGLPENTTTEGRNLAGERETWRDEDTNDPRLPGFLDIYPETAISTGLRLRPGHHLNLLSTIDPIDRDFMAIWLGFIYEGMYARGVLDDRIRYLCMVGNTLAVGESYQMRRHMLGALRCGASARELFEIICLSGFQFGHPNLVPQAVDDLILIAADEGRLDELVNEHSDEVVRIARARYQRRSQLGDVEHRVDGGAARRGK